MTDRAAVGRRSIRKGKNFERKIANILKDLWPEAKRGWQTRGGTSEEPDVKNTPYYLELKCGKSTNPKAAMAQARAASDGRPPVAITHDDRGPILVTMDMALFLELHQRLDQLEQAVKESPRDNEKAFDKGYEKGFAEGCTKGYSEGFDDGADHV